MIASTQRAVPFSTTDAGPATPPSDPSLGTSTPFSLSSSSPESNRRLCEACTCPECIQRKSRPKRAEARKNSPDGVGREFLRPRLLEFLSEYWETLQVHCLYHLESSQTLEWTVDDSPWSVCRLHYHLLLEHLNTEDDLYLWRRSIAEINNLNAYRAFLAEAEEKLKHKSHTRETGVTNSQKAHKAYLTYIYADRSPVDFEKAKESLKRNLEFGRRWSILIDGFTDEGSVVVPGLTSGTLLLCGPAIRKKIYNSKKAPHSCLKSLVRSIRQSYPYISKMCQILQAAATNLAQNHRLALGDDLAAVTTNLRSLMEEANTDQF